MKKKRELLSPANAGYACEYVLMLFALVGLVIGTVASPALAQENDPMEELKETLKREILEELRGDLSLGSDVAIDVEALKKEIIQEILQELREEEEFSNATAEQTKEKVEQDAVREIVGDLTPRQTQEHPQFVRPVTGPMGDAEGLMLRRGVGLPGCRVKLVALSGSSARFRAHAEGQEYIEVTDKHGKYRFEQIPPGPYKIKWELPGDTGWIRRIQDRPDVTVIAGKLVVLKPVETARALVSQ